MFRSAFNSVKSIAQRDLMNSEPQINSVTSRTIIGNRQETLRNNSNATKVYQTGSENEEPVPFLSLFRLATKTDVALIVVSLAASLLNGFCFPISVILFGRLSAAFVEFEQDGHHSNLTTRALNLSVVATPNTDALLLNSPQNDNSSLIDDVIFFCVGTATIHIVSVFLSFIFVTCLNISAENQILRCRDLCVKAVLRQEIGWYDTRTTDGFATHLSENLSKMQDGIGEKLGMLLTNFSIALICIISAFWHGWELASINAIALPVLAITTGALSKIVAALSIKEAAAYTQAGSLAEEVISAIRTVAMFSAERKEVNQFELALKPAEKAAVKRGLATAVGSGVLWFVTYSSYALSFWYGVGLVLDDAQSGDQNYDAAKLNIIFFNMLYAAIKLGLLLPFIEAIGSARIAASSVFRIIDRVPLIDAASNFITGQIPATISGNLRFEDVGFNYPSRPNVQALRGVTFSVSAGETVALVGASGSGKSTCVQLLQRFYDPTQGWILLDSHDIKDLDVSWLRSQIGVVGQEPVLFRDSIRANIRSGVPSGVKVTDHEIEQVARMANAHDFIQRLPQGYDTLVGERGAQLSGGQKQRIAIARALLRKPKILLLDEATSALDNESEAIVQQALEKARQGRTTVIVAHRLSTIRNSDRIIVFNQGAIEEAGDHESLMAKKGIYYRLVDREYHTVLTDNISNENADKPMKPQQESKLLTQLDDSSVSPVSTSSTEDTSGVKPEQNTSAEETQDSKEDVSFMQILKWNEPEWMFLAFGVCGSVLLGVSIPLYALIYGEVMGLLSQSDDGDIYDRRDFFSLMFVINALIAGTGAFVQIFMFSLAGERLTCRIRKQMYEAMLYRPIAWFDRPEHSAGALCSRLASDATAIQGLTGTRFGLLIQVSVSIFVALILSLVWNWKLALASAALVPIVLISAIVGMRIGSGDSKARVKALEKSAGVAAEAIANIRTVVSLGLEGTFHLKYMGALEDSRSLTTRNAAIRGLTYAFTSNASAFASIVCMGYGGYLIQYEALPYKQVFKTCEALIFGMEMIGQAMAFTPNYARAKMAAARIYELIQRNEPKFSDRQYSRVILSAVEGKVAFDNVHFSYPTRPGHPIVQGLTASIQPGTTVALVGQSGCGKSTCFQLLQRFYEPDQGSITVDDRDVRLFTDDSLRSHLGVVSQEPALFNRTIGENIAYGERWRETTVSEIIEAAKKANIHSFIQSLPLGYRTNVGKGGMQLSGGQKQRIAIARTLIRNPEILLLDEATSALDGESERVVQDALFNVSQDRTCIVIAHRLSTIRTADRILVLHRGQVHEEGTHDELMRQHGMYRSLWNIQGILSDSEFRERERES